MESVKVISPVDNQLYVERPLTTACELKKKAQQATIAQQAWQQVSIEERAVICHRALDYFQDPANVDEIAAEICWQMGRPIRYCSGELNGLDERGRYLISIAEEALSAYPLINSSPTQQPTVKHSPTINHSSHINRSIRREPLGVVLVIAPWNYPYLTAVNTIIPALMAGNAVLLKHASQTPLCAERFYKAFIAAGLPENLFQYAHVTHASVESLIQSKLINYVAFTGSVPAGATIEAQLAGHFIGRGMELGGKDPAYVRHDADIEYSAQSLVDGAFFNSGQSCCAIERIYVDQSVYDPFVECFVAQVKQYQVGNPTDAETTLGPLVNLAAKQWVMQQSREALQKGATALIDPNNDFPKFGDETAYLSPQVFINVDHEFSLMSEESFGPVVGIMPVNDDQQAIQHMNDSDFGLTASIWTQDEEVATAIGQSIETGTVFMNRCDYLDPALAWTGVKQSGYGCTLSHYGYHALTRLKSYHFKRL